MGVWLHRESCVYRLSRKSMLRSFLLSLFYLISFIFLILVVEGNVTCLCVRNVSGEAIDGIEDRVTDTETDERLTKTDCCETKYINEILKGKELLPPILRDKIVVQTRRLTRPLRLSKFRPGGLTVIDQSGTRSMIERAVTCIYRHQLNTSSAWRGFFAIMMFFLQVYLATGYGDGIWSRRTGESGRMAEMLCLL
eukprot:GHVQ01016448.1.p1 GENE.GHVQ01016448.1~~GHVQ01016448.1.p1  ORF type:complete len:195 (+),score=14.47 GHVQ01016448.1:232-816(+)